MSCEQWQSGASGWPSRKIIHFINSPFPIPLVTCIFVVVEIKRSLIKKKDCFIVGICKSGAPYCQGWPKDEMQSKLWVNYSVKYLCLARFWPLGHLQKLTTWDGGIIPSHVVHFHRISSWWTSIISAKRNLTSTNGLMKRWRNPEAMILQGMPGDQNTLLGT